MNDMIRGLGLKGPGWMIGIDLDVFLQGTQNQVRRLLKLLDTAESHNALEPVSCGDPATGTPRILAAAMALEEEIPERMCKASGVEYRELKAAWKRISRHKELIEKWIQTQK